MRATFIQSRMPFTLVLSQHHPVGDTNSWGKMTNFETATRNVLAFLVPGQTPASVGRVEDIVEMVDVFPTQVLVYPDAG